MATATKKSRAAGQRTRRAGGARVPESMELVVFEDNGGAHRWRIVAGDGATLAQSGSFASFDRAAAFPPTSAKELRHPRRRGARSTAKDARADAPATFRRGAPIGDF